MHWLIALLALGGTLLQTWTALPDIAASNRATVQWQNAEDQLLAEVPRWPRSRRRDAKRDLVGMRDSDVARSIKHINLVLIGWVLLDVAALYALIDAVF